MMKDPVCGMEVSEEAKNMIHAEHETFYLCSERCKAPYVKQTGISKPTARKGFFGIFLKTCQGK